jgi:hypothetical protein
VSLVPESSAWDESFTPESVGDPSQLSLPGISWEIKRDDDKHVQRVVGYGKVVLTIEDGVMLIVLGNDEHRLEAKLGGDLVHTEMTRAVQDAEAKKQDGEAETVDTTELVRGPLGDKAVRDRLAHVKQPDTLLGVFILEKRNKTPRARVIATIEELAADIVGPLLTDMGAIAEGRTRTDLKPDLDAAVLLTNRAKPPRALLDQHVPGCRDTIVLGWILDDELERGTENQRDEVIDCVRARLAALGFAPEAAANESANDADDSMGDAADAEHQNMVH